MNGKLDLEIYGSVLIGSGGSFEAHPELRFLGTDRRHARLKRRLERVSNPNRVEQRLQTKIV